VREYLSKKVYVLGAINRPIAFLAGHRSGPGIYPLKGRITALEQILQAGGPAPGARLKNVHLIRAGQIYTLDLSKGR